MRSASTSRQFNRGYEGHGLLTFVLSQGLAGGDYDLEGAVSTQELARDIDECVRAHANRARRDLSPGGAAKSGCLIFWSATEGQLLMASRLQHR